MEFASIRAYSSFYIVLPLQAYTLYYNGEHYLNAKLIFFSFEVTRKDEFMFVQIILISAKFLTATLGSLLPHAR